MVESIAPVVYGTKSRYRVAVGLHAGAAGLAGAAFGALLGTIGLLLQAPWGTPGSIAVAIAASAYAGRELLGLPLPLFDRRQQVPDWWRTFYGPHVAAALYGAGLGIGFFTFLRYGTYVVVCALALASGEPAVGALLGAAFGLSRGLTTLVSASAADEVEAADVVARLETVAVGLRPKLANGLILVALAVVALATACDTSETDALRARGTRTAAETPSPRGYAGAEVVGRLNKSIDESSGLVASRAHEGVLWTHNDSGGGPYIYAIDEHGRSLGRWRVTGAEAFDWEDIALGSDGDLFIGDIGDNTSSRDHITIYRVPEPDPATGGGDTEASVAIDLTYPDRAHDAEALLVEPTTGDMYVLTKQLSGRTTVYVAGPDATTLERVAVLDVPDGFGGVTAADVSSDGTRVVLGTYTGAVELTLPSDATSFDEIWKQEPFSFDAGSRAQGEAIAYDAEGTDVYTTSEGPRSPLFLVRAIEPTAPGS